MICKRLPALLVLFLLLLPTISLSHDQHESAARLAAEDFLQTLDAQSFDAAWLQTSEINQSYQHYPFWFQKILAVRPHLGLVNSRGLKTVSHHDGWVGLPDGEYLRLSFATEFSNKQNSLETIVLIKEKGLWLVSSYHLR